MPHKPRGTARSPETARRLSAHVLAEYSAETLAFRRSHSHIRRNGSAAARSLFHHYGNIGMTTIDDIRENFELLEDWDDRYRYVIELGRTLEPMPEAEHSAANKVQGCVSQVWLQKLVDRENGAPILKYRGDSDAHIVRGLVAIVLALYSGRAP